MKKLYSGIGLMAMAAALGAGASAGERTQVITTATLSPTESAQQRTLSRGSEGMVITDLVEQVQGRYSCEYYSPLIWEETGEPFGWCIEQPMIAEDYFAEEEGDVNIGYLFFLNCILKGHVDMANGTITIPPRFATTYYENDDDDEGMPVWFVTVDIKGNKYVANYERPWTGTFELHDGKITKISSEDRWGYSVQDNAGNDIGWFEIAENTTWYLGHGEMEYYNGDLNGDGVLDNNDKEQTVVYAESDGKTAKVYNAFRSGWDNPISIDLNVLDKTAVISEQSIDFKGAEAWLADESNATAFSGIIRNSTWDTDKRDELANSVLEFPMINVVDKSSKENVHQYGNVRFYFKEDLSELSALEDISVDMPEGPAVYYNLSGVRVSGDNLAPGVYILRQGNKTTKVVK